MTQTYRHKPTTIKAIQYVGENDTGIGQWTGMAPHDPYPMFWVFEHGAMLYVQANSAWVDVEVGEWIAKDRHGFYPIKPDVFAESYEPVDD